MAIRTADTGYPPSDRAFDRRIALIFSLRLTAEGFSYRSRRRSSRFSPERSSIFRSRRTASWADSRSRSTILTKGFSPPTRIGPPARTGEFPLIPGTNDPRQA